MLNYTPLVGDDLWRMTKQMERQEAEAKLPLANKLAIISQKNDRTPKYNNKQTWTKTMLFNYQQVIDKAEAAANNGKREVYVDIQYNSENSTETQCIIKYLHEIDDFTVTTIKLRGTGKDPIDFESTLKVEW